MARKVYPSDVNDAKWRIIKPLLPSTKAIGRPRQDAWQICTSLQSASTLTPAIDSASFEGICIQDKALL